MTQIRLQKIIADAGVTSRRKAEEMIEDGRVRVNRHVVTELGAKADPAKDLVEVDKKPITGSNSYAPKHHILLYKPKGVISSVTDPERRPVVTDFVRKIKARLYPVGRLDFDAEGAIILTNDGELTNRLIHPRYKVPKRYLVKVSDHPDERQIKRLQNGVRLDDGMTAPAKVRLVRETAENSWLEITVIEGRNRLIKRMCQAVGHPVLKLKRVAFAGITLRGLKPGDYRALTGEEVSRLSSFQVQPRKKRAKTFKRA